MNSSAIRRARRVSTFPAAV